MYTASQTFTVYSSVSEVSSVESVFHFLENSEQFENKLKHFSVDNEEIRQLSPEVSLVVSDFLAHYFVYWVHRCRGLRQEAVSAGIVFIL